LQNVAMILGRHTIGKAVERNNVRAFGEHRNTIHDELETLSPLIGDAAQFHRTQPGSCFDTSRYLAADSNRSRKPVAALSAISYRVPQLWRGNSERKRNMIHAGIQLHRLGEVGSL